MVCTILNAIEGHRLTSRSEQALEELGLAPHLAENPSSHKWDYTTLSDAPPPHPDAARWSLPVYRGLVPAKLINSRDFALNGTVVRLTSHLDTSVTLDLKMPVNCPGIS